jgi:hypothetical protein
MLLQYIFDQLTTGELSKLSIGGAENGYISPDNYKKVVNHINLGLQALHSRFSLREGRAVLTLTPGVKQYVLTGRDPAVLLSDESGGTFAGDLLKLEEVQHPDGSAYALNEKNNPYGMSTPSITTLRLPDEWKDGLIPNELRLVYRAAHPQIEVTSGMNPEEVEVDLPHSHLWALLMFVASRAHTPVGMTNEFHAGNSYYAKYEAACQDLLVQNLEVDSNHSNTKFHRNGWC